MSGLEQQVSEAASEAVLGEGREAELKEEVRLTRLEASGHISHIHALKESNFQLTQVKERRRGGGRLES